MKTLSGEWRVVVDGWLTMGGLRVQMALQAGA